MYHNIALGIDELWLKGKNRPMYFKAIKRHIKDLVSAYHEDKFTLVNEQQRLVVESETAFSEDILEALQRVPGLATVSPCIKVAMEKEAILPALSAELDKLPVKRTTFKVMCKRVNKKFPTASMELNRYVATHVLKNYEHIKVDVHNPDFYIYVRVMDGHIYLYTRQIRAVGGLPIGTSGHAVTLISGGFDSPVASYMMAKRGCRQTYIFFYAYPFVGEEVRDKIVSICSHLSKFQRFGKLYVVPFGDVQNHISKKCREEYRTLLFRKYMIQTANLLADKIQADSLVTGDALGQVSSQTMENMTALDLSSNRLILRPLVGHNKLEIIDTARKIGTHDISIIPHDDACELFSPKHPVIKPDLDYWSEFIKGETEVESLLEKALSDAEFITFDLKGEIVKK
jgi:thiamine biosynthesis protein ThiI